VDASAEFQPILSLTGWTVLGVVCCAALVYCVYVYVVEAAVTVVKTWFTEQLYTLGSSDRNVILEQPTVGLCDVPCPCTVGTVETRYTLTVTRIHQD